MLESLDLLIAFSLIMTVVSLLITVVVQMVSAAFNLRGRNLASGLVQTFLTAGGPRAESADALTREQAQRLAGFLLTRSGLSDSAFGGRGGLSDPLELGGFSQSKAPLGGAYRWALAGAVRPEELYAAIRALAGLGSAGQVPAGGADLVRSAQMFLRGLGVPEAGAAGGGAGSMDDGAARFADQLRSAVEAVSARMGEEEREALEKGVAVLRQSADAAAAAAKEAANGVVQAADQTYQRFRFWFQSGQDRAQHWFTTHTRWWTAGLALVAAFYLQLDSVEIYRDLSRNPTLAKAIAAQTSSITERAESLLVVDGSLYREAIQLWARQQTNAAAMEKLKPLEGIDFTAEDTRATASEKVRKESPGGDLEVTGSFDEALDEVVAERLKLKQAEFKTLRTAFDAAGFELMPAQGQWRWGKRYTDGLGSHFLGMLFSAALLTLGAPFWFNTLKSLTNLRSTLANKIDVEQAGAGGRPTRGGRGKPPVPRGTAH